MKLIFTVFIFLTLTLSAFAQAEDELKIEGKCNGNLADGTKVSFTYFSNFNGCQQKIRAAIQFAPNFGSGYYKGKREFEDSKDIYTMENYRVTFKDSTGNVSGIFSYLDIVGKRQSINVQCDIRDYEYDECHN
jgi:hypothetical protein